MCFHEDAGDTDCDSRDVLLVCNADRTGFDAFQCGRGERCRGTPTECLAPSDER